MTEEDKKRKRITKKFIEEQLDKVYNRETYDLTIKDKDLFAKETDSVYGEITRESVDKILVDFKKYFGKNAVFYDLGCGNAKFVMHVALKTKVKKACGVELSKDRFDKALEYASEIEFPRLQPQILNANFLTVDYSDATVAYVDNTMYPYLLPEIMKVLPKGCLLIYKSGGWNTGDRFFQINTSYNDKDLKTEFLTFWNAMASFRFIE